MIRTLGLLGSMWILAAACSADGDRGIAVAEVPTSSSTLPPSTTTAPPSSAPSNAVPLTSATSETGITASGLRFRVALPAGYVPGGNHPVLYHLHGATQTWEALETDIAALAAMVERATRDGTLPAIVIVAPHDETGWSMWTDSRSGENDMASTILDELIPQIEDTYDVTPGADARMLQGFSMGGFGAASLGLAHPDQFGSVSVWDGAMHDWDSMSGERPWIAADQFGDDEAFFRSQSPWELAAALEAGTMPVLVVEALMTDFATRYGDHLADHGHDPTRLITSCPHDVPCIADAAGPEITRFLARSLNR